MIDRIQNNRSKHEQERLKGGIEKLVHAEIPEHFKTLAILAYTGAKPLSQLDIPYRPDFMERIDAIREALRSLGVAHEETIYGNHSGERIEFTMARDAETLERARSLNALHRHKTANRFGEQWHREYGTLLGFPPTAVEAFVQHQPLLSHLPDDVRHTELGRFFNNVVMMKLSQAHWRQELKAIEKWMESIRAVSPEYLEHLISDSNSPHSGGH